MALAENESKGAVVLMGVALLAVLGAAYGIFVGLGRPIDGAALLAERFAYEELPLQLTVARAHRLGSGDQLVELVPLEGVEDAALERVVVHFFEEAESPAMTFPDEPFQLDQQALGKWREEPKDFFRGELQRGRVEFDAWDVMYIRERIFRVEPIPTEEREEAQAEETTVVAPGTHVVWNDNLRVNLSTEGLPCVLFAYFPDEVDGDPAVLTELLDGLELR